MKASHDWDMKYLQYKPEIDKVGMVHPTFFEVVRYDKYILLCSTKLKIPHNTGFPNATAASSVISVN